MLYKPAAYVYLVALTMALLFTTSQAEIDMKRGRETMTILFNRLIRIVLKHRSNNLDALMKTTHLVMSATLLENYMLKTAEDGNVCQYISDAIDEYEGNFRQLVSDIRPEQKEDEKIPIYNSLKNLREVCNSTYGGRSTSQTTQTTQVDEVSSSLGQFSLKESDESTSNAGITLKRLLAEEDEVHPVDENVTDEIGFKINKGILEVQILLDQFLQIVLHKRCGTLKDLKDFANSMTHYTSFYNAVLAAAPHYEEYIKKCISDYSSNFERMLIGSGVEEIFKNVPIGDKVYDIWRRSEKGTGASSSTSSE